MNGLPQCWQAFQNGYTRFAFQCLGKLECFASAAFNNDTMVSADDLLAKISDKTVGGIAVVVFNDFKDRLVGVFAMLNIVTEYAITYFCFMVWHDAFFCSYLCSLVKAPINPRDHVPNLKPRVLDANRHPVLRPRAGKRQQMPAGLQHPQALAPDRLAGHVVVPALFHEREPIRRIGHDRVDRVIRKLFQALQAVTDQQPRGAAPDLKIFRILFVHNPFCEITTPFQQRGRSYRKNQI